MLVFGVLVIVIVVVAVVVAAATAAAFFPLERDWFRPITYPLCVLPSSFFCDCFLALYRCFHGCCWCVVLQNQNRSSFLWVVSRNQNITVCIAVFTGVVGALCSRIRIDVSFCGLLLGIKISVFPPWRSGCKVQGAPTRLLARQSCFWTQSTYLGEYDVVSFYLFFQSKTFQR